MSFATYDFLFYFMPPALALLLFASFFKRNQLFLPAIILTSAIYYGLGSIPHLILLLSLIGLSWTLAYLYERSRPHAYAGLLIGLGVILNLSALAIWKYGESLVELWNSFGWIQVAPPGLLMPLGISFYVFQQVGFLLDLRRGKASLTSPVHYAGFIMFFPQLIAGPIVTHKRMTREFKCILAGLGPEERVTMAWQGVAWFSLGMFKKVVLADSLGRIATPLMSKAAFGELSMIEAWELALIAPSRVYFDFCGYSEMAVGLALFIGLRIPANFNAPFRANSLRQFWTRWHITFHHFVRDHIYAPIRKATIKWPIGNAFALFFAITISSLWHGNSIQFFFWGILVWLSMFVTTRLFSVFSPRMRTIFTLVLSLSFFTVLGILFTSPDLDTAKSIIGKLVAVSSVSEGLATMSLEHWRNIGFILFMIFVLRVEISTQVLLSSNAEHSDRHILGYRPPLWSPNLGWLLFFCVLLLISFHFVGISPPFVYFQF